MGAAGSVIPATREAALADGYTEAEIDAYIASKSPIEGTSMPATASNTTSTSVSNTDKSIHNPEGEQQEVRRWTEERPEEGAQAKRAEPPATAAAAPGHRQQDRE